MAVNLSPVGGVAAQFFTSTGAVLTGGKLYTYAAGTTTPAVTYTSSNGLTAWTNPIVLDAAGRVPGSGEIWLTDGINYKFVLKDANDVLIATYDNISGINSNFVAYTNSQEIQTATAGQTVFTLTTMQYQVATNSLSVFVDGVNQYGPGAQYSYIETDSTTVTFNAGLHVGAEVKFTTTQQQGAGLADASQITYDPPFNGGEATNVELKLAQIVSVKDFGAVGDGITPDTAAIQAAHDYAASLTTTGMAQVVFPAGVYVFTSLNWSPLVSIFCGGQVVLKTSITSGKGIHVSTQFGNWSNPQNQIDYHGNILVSGGKLMIQNTNGKASNTATGIFFGDDGIANYSAESISLYCVHFEGWKYSHRFGSHAYLISFLSSFFGDNDVAIFNDVGSYIDRNERMTYINCTFAGNTSVIDGDANCYGDFSFQSCSFDYNTQIIPNTLNTMIVSVGGGSHLETDSTTSSAPFFTMNGGSLNLDSYLAAWFAPGGGSGADPIIASCGANSFVRSKKMTALTPTGATLFKLTDTTAKVEPDDDFKQLGGVTGTYINNVIGGYVEKWFSPISGMPPNNFLLGEYPEIKARLVGVYTHEFEKTGVGIGATVDLFSVGPIISYATGRLTIKSTSSGVMTVKIVDFALIGGGTPGGTNITVSENYNGGSSFTITETANSPSAGYNKVSLTNTSGVACNLSCSLQVNFVSTGGSVTPL